ncbi:MAG TPA: SDR family oxidoreductase [Verrucomicrobiae bacterium]
MKCLIVGCGYVGLALGLELRRLGHTVYGMQRGGSAELLAAGIQPVLADITQPALLAKLPADFDWVINCAASAGGSVDEYRRLYIEGNRNLALWLARAPLKKFVYTSSTSVYGQTDGSFVTETSPAEPAEETSQALVAAERVLQDAATKGKLPAVILRVAGIYGPGRGHWFKQFVRGEARIEGDGSRWLNMIHRDDVVGAIIAALEHGRAGEVYNAADNEPVTQLQFFEWLAEKLNQPLPPKVPAEEIARRKRGVTNKRVSNEKLRRELKYVFRFPDFRAGYAAEIHDRI